MPNDLAADVAYEQVESRSSVMPRGITDRNTTTQNGAEPIPTARLICGCAYRPR